MDEKADLALGGDAPFYAQVILNVEGRAPLLADPRLARLALGPLRACDAPGRLWGALVLPDSARCLVGPVPGDATLDRYVACLKSSTEAALLPAIRRADDDTLDAVLHYSPVWGAAIYRLWAPGCHLQRYWTTYKLSNALYALRQAPVEAGLVAHPEDWPYVWLGG